MIMLATDRSAWSCRRPHRADTHPTRPRRCRAESACRVEGLEPRTLLAFVPQGPEFRVNTTTAGNQLYTDVASDARGDFVVAWDGEGRSGYGIYGQRYNDTGVPQGGEFLVTGLPVQTYAPPKVGMDADGDFVVAWNGPDGSGYGVFARRYDAAGVPQGDTFRVNTTTAGDQGGATTIAFDAAGNSVITWASSGPGSFFADLYLQRYNATGVPQGGEVRIDTDPAGYYGEASVAFDAGGGFVVAWQRQGGIYARRYDAAGVPQGEEVFVNDDGHGGPRQVVSSDAAGNFAVVWRITDEDGFGIGVYGRYFNAAAVPQGEPFRVDTLAIRKQTRPTVASAADGGFVVAWETVVRDPYAEFGGRAGVVARRYNAAGVPEGAEFRVSSFSEQNPGSEPAIAADADGDIVVTWNGRDIWNGEDDSSFGVYARRFVESDLPFPVAVTQVLVNGPGLTGQTSQEGDMFQVLAKVDNTYGHAVAAGADQLKSIPWNGGVKQVAIRFDHDVSAFLGQDDLAVHGVNTPDYAVTAFRYDPTTWTGVWTLSAPVTNDRLALVLDDAGITGLDGEWANGSDAYPGGDGTAGGDFRFGVNVLRGDANQDGRVNAMDLALIKQKLNTNAPNPGNGSRAYSPFADLNADGFINALDLAAAKVSLNRQLPPPPSSATSLLFGNDRI